MTTRIIQQGDQYMLPLDRETVERMGITPETPLDITTDGRTLHVSKMNGQERDSKFQAALKDTNEKYGEMLQRLA